jgi:hypothetical protein
MRVCAYDPSGTVLGIEDDKNFKKLPELDQHFHAWAMAAHPVRPTAETAAECFDKVATATKHRNKPLGNIPIIVISTPNDSPKYGDLQTAPLSLSGDSRQMIAGPEVITRAIQQVVSAVRSHSERNK